LIFIQTRLTGESCKSRYINADEVLTTHNYEGVPPEGFRALAFDNHPPQGRMDFHESFKAES
jgi:hypothetical protein